MRRLQKAVLLAFCGAGLWGLLAAAPASAAINKQISFQGKLTNTDGTNVTDGNFSIRFRIYNDPSADAANTCSANSCKWEETQATVAVGGGLFQVNLGSVASLPASVDFNASALYLGVKVGSDAEMIPRIQLTAAPYAFNSDLLDGLDSTAFAQLTGGNLNLGTGTVTSGAVNGLTLTQAADGFTVAGGTTSRTLTVQGANITIGSTIQPTSAGALSIQSNGANALNLDAGGAAAINIGVSGTSVNAINIGNTTSNPNIAFTGSGTFGTTTGTVSLNGNITVASGKNLTLTSGGFTQTYSASTASNAHGISLTNSNTGTGVIINGVNITPTNNAVPASGNNTLNGVNFTSGGALGGSDITNGINFASASGYSNFINSPSFILSSSGAISGVTTISTSSTINSNTFSSSSLTFGAASTAAVASAGGQALTLTGNSASTWSTTAGNLTIQAGSGTVSLGSSTVLSSTGALAVNSGAATALTVDSGTTGALNLGTSSNAKTITVGNTTGATAIANFVGGGTNVFSIQGASSAVYVQLDTTNSRLYVGNPTADGTAFQLVLDSRNVSGETGAPAVTGINGGMYYNSANNKFRCFENSVWKNCTSSTGDTFSTVQSAAATAATKAAAGTILIAPIYVSGQTTVNEMRVSVITTVLGAAGDVGIYNLAGTLVLNGGSSTLTTAIGLKTIAPVQTGVARILEPGQYYAAVTWNATTGSVSSAALPVAGLIKRVGTITGGGLVLPASLTLSGIATAVNIPAVSINN
jgi:hypothetical protein